MRIPEETKRQISLYRSGSEWNFVLLVDVVQRLKFTTIGAMDAIASPRYIQEFIHVTCMWKFYLQGQGEMEPGFIVKLIYYIINNV
jgi:hypothetical protein